MLVYEMIYGLRRFSGENRGGAQMKHKKYGVRTSINCSCNIKLIPKLKI